MSDKRISFFKYLTGQRDSGRGSVMKTHTLLVLVCLAITFRGCGTLSITPTQCEYLLDEFSSTFLDSTSAKPTSCSNQPIQLMWTQCIRRLYGDVNNFEDIRNLPDDKLSTLLVNAAAGSLIDPNSPRENANTIRLNAKGQYERYASQNASRISSLQTVCFLTILALAASWYHFKQVSQQ
jgi:hypothetical protein